MPDSGPTLPEAVSVREFSIHCHDLELAVKCWEREGGDSNNIPLVALHGWMDNAGTFEHLVPALDYFPFYALDFSGHGASSHRSASDDYYMWGYVEEVVTLLDYLGAKQCVLLGHSMGGAVATLLAAIYPERVSRLLLLDSIGPLTTAEADLPLQLRNSLEAKRDTADQRPRHYPERSLAEQSRANSGVSLESAAILGQRGLGQDENGYYWRTDQKLKRRNPVSMSEAQVLAFLARIAAPALLIAAAPNYANTGEGIEDRLAVIKNLQIEQLPGNHFQHLEGHVPEVAERIREFLSLTEYP